MMMMMNENLLQISEMQQKFSSLMLEGQHCPAKNAGGKLMSVGVNNNLWINQMANCLIA